MTIIYYPLQINTENVHSLLAGGNAELVGDPTWLYPILLPSITDTLMGLYRVHYAVDNEKLSATLRDLNGKADDELCELLELQRSVFFTCPGHLDPAMFCCFCIVNMSTGKRVEIL